MSSGLTSSATSSAAAFSTAGSSGIKRRRVKRTSSMKAKAVVNKTGAAIIGHAAAGTSSAATVASASNFVSMKQLLKPNGIIGPSKTPYAKNTVSSLAKKTTSSIRDGSIAAGGAVGGVTRGGGSSRKVNFPTNMASVKTFTSGSTVTGKKPPKRKSGKIGELTKKSGKKSRNGKSTKVSVTKTIGAVGDDGIIGGGENTSNQTLTTEGNIPLPTRITATIIDGNISGITTTAATVDTVTTARTLDMMPPSTIPKKLMGRKILKSKKQQQQQQQQQRISGGGNYIVQPLNTGHARTASAVASERMPPVATPKLESTPAVAAAPIMPQATTRRPARSVHGTRAVYPIKLRRGEQQSATCANIRNIPGIITPISVRELDLATTKPPYMRPSQIEYKFGEMQT